MIIPEEAKKIGSSEKLKTPIVTYVCIFFAILSLLAMFGFCVSIGLDIEYDSVSKGKGTLLILLTIAICLTIFALSSGPVVCGLTRKVRNQYDSVFIDSNYLYFREKYGRVVAIPLTSIIGDDDNKPYVNTFYDLGTKAGVISYMFEAYGRLKIKYRDNNEIKTIVTYVQSTKATKDIISEAIANTRGQVFTDSFKSDGEKLVGLFPGYIVIAFVTLIGFAVVSLMIIGFHIEDIVEFDKKPDIALLVVFGILTFGGLPIFIMIMKTFAIHRKQPHHVILTDYTKGVHYLFKKGKYIEVPFDSIVSSKAKNSKVRVISGSYKMRNFDTGKYDTYYTYKNVEVPEGRVTIRYKKNGITHKYFVYVADAYSSPF